MPRHVRDIRRRLANNFDRRGELGVASEPLPSNDSDFLMESSEPSEDGAGRDENASTSCVQRVARKRQLPVRFNDFFVNCYLNITGECKGKLKCCALYAYEHGPLYVCAPTCLSL